MWKLNSDKRRGFPKSCTEYISFFVKARVFQDTLRGLGDVNASVKNGLAVVAQLGLPSLHAEAFKLLENTCRSGKCDCHPPATYENPLWRYMSSGKSHFDIRDYYGASVGGDRLW